MQPISLWRPGLSSGFRPRANAVAAVGQRRHVKAGDRAAPLGQRAQRVHAAGEVQFDVQAVLLRRALRAAAAAPGRGWRASTAPAGGRPATPVSTRCSSARRASMCGTRRARARVSAHSRRSANGVRRAGWPCAQVTSGSPSSASQRLSAPQTWRYDAPSARAACWIEPCSCTACSRSNSGLCTSAPCCAPPLAVCWKLYCEVDAAGLHRRDDSAVAAAGSASTSTRCARLSRLCTGRKRSTCGSIALTPPARGSKRS